MSERDLFLAALDQPTAADRERFLGRLAADRPTAAGRLRELLREHDAFATGPAGPGDAPAPAEGTLVGRPGARYKLLQLLGEGGMGSVWAADQLEPVRRRVAVKLIRPGADAAAVGPRFDQERQALAVMDHPNIARVFDAGADDAGRPFVALELVKGCPLTEYADAGRLTPAERVALLVPVCRAVQHAHQKGVIHRDLKPGNVLVGVYDGRPVPKVIDFGIAKAVGGRLADRTVFTRIGAVVGTPAYMAPEQAELDNVDVDTRADVYSLGVILYELLTGTAPLAAGPGGGLLDLLRQVRETEPAAPSARLSTVRDLPAVAGRRRTPPARLPGLVRGELDWIVLKCLEKDRSRRYQTAAELADDLERHLAGRPVQAGPPTRRYRLAKFVRAYRAWVVGGAAAVAALVAAAGVSAGMAVRATRAEAAARAAAADADRERVAQRQEADTARAVLRFLQDMIAQANPTRQDDGRDPGLTVQAALDRAAGRADTAFPGRPRIEGAVRHSLGAAYKGLGRHTDARRQFERAIELSTAAVGPTHPDTLAARQLLAVTRSESGELAAAEAELRAVLAAWPDADPEPRRTARHALAVVARKAGRFAEAAAELEAVLADYEAAAGPTDGRALATRAELAELDNRRGQFRRAEAGYRAVLARGGRLGDDHPLLIAASAGVARAVRLGGRPAEAEPLAAAAAARAAARLGPAHPHTLAAEVERAGALFDLDRPAEAEPLLRGVIERDAGLGPDHESALAVRLNLGQVLAALDRPAEAEPLFTHVVSRRTALYGPTHPHTLSATLGLADCHFARQDWGRAEPLYRAVLAADPDNLPAASHLGLLCRRTGRHADAEPLLKAASARADERFGAGHPQAARSFANLFSLYEHWQRPAAGEAAARERLARVAADPTLAGAAADLEAMLGRLALRAGRFADAEGRFRSALGRHAAAGRRDWKVAYAESQLGAALAGLGRAAEAVPLLERGLAGMTAATDMPAADRKPLLDQAAARLAAARGGNR